MVYTCMQPTVTDSNLKQEKSTQALASKSHLAPGPRAWLADRKKVNNTREEGRGGDETEKVKTKPKIMVKEC